MNYGTQFKLGCTLDKWDPTTKKGSVNDTRWCGELPPKAKVPTGFPRAGQDWYNACDASSSLMLTNVSGDLVWTCGGIPIDYGNRAAIASDIPKRMGDGELDLSTGYQMRYPINQIEESDYTFSRGRLCAQDLGALNETEGLSICRERGIALPVRKTFGSIDFNANGVIDPKPVDLFTTESIRIKWFWKDIPRQQVDVDEWDILEFNKYGATPIGVPCSLISRWNHITLTACQD